LKEQKNLNIEYISYILFMTAGRYTSIQFMGQFVNYILLIKNCPEIPGVSV